jgi:dipeptidyl aminopeptidase/acylaminoacyl peptidase
VRIVDVATGKTDDQITDNYAFGPEWDPANPWRIVTSGIDGLDQLDVNRQALWQLTDRREDHTPAFSPDGKYIAVAYNQGGRYDIHRLDASGSGRVILTESPLWLAAEGKRPWNNVAPAWSPDGSRVAFLTDRTGRWEIWVMGADGSHPQPMFDDALNAQLQFKYDFIDERMLSWGGGQ